MAAGNISQEFKLKNIDRTRNYFIEETNQNEFMSKKQETVLTASNYIESLLSLTSAYTGSVSISAFVSLVGVLVGTTSSAVRLKDIS